MLRRLANTAWRIRCQPARRALDSALAAPETAQAAVLMSILRRNASTAFGREFGFGALTEPREFQSRVPEQDYGSLEPLIRRTAAGEPGLLTAESTLMFEPTSGSSSAAKWIPYTASLRAEYQRAIRAWVADLFAAFPAMRAGSAYWAISPLSRQDPSHTPGGIRIGYGSDAEYLGRFERWAAARSFAVPQEVARATDLDRCLDLTCRHLRAARDLAFISVWSPTFLELILDRIGSDASELWPNLSAVSCWADGPAAPAARRLAHRLPNVTLQPKGLLATEGVVTIPLAEFGGNVLAANAHFYEFAPVAGGPPRLAHELESGAEYTVLLTTGGGLYRYRLGDRVRVSGFAKRAPMLEFLGREGGVSDLCGEKLNPAFVQDALDSLRPSTLPADAFAMLAPADAGGGYVLFTSACADGGRLAHSLEAALGKNPHYAYARRLGQLDHLRVVKAGGDAPSRHLARCISLGMRAGDVKPPSLDARGGWEAWFGVNVRKDSQHAGAL
ncbi:GH3 auxin-responsive promoter family protein [soil metagenome]